MNLGQTQRDVIRSHNAEAQRSAFSPIAEQTPTGVERFGISDPGSVRRRKVPLWPKLIVFVIGVAILIGALVALVWFFKSDSSAGDIGSVIEPPKKIPACPDVQYSLGDKLEFHCNITPTGTVKAEFVNSVLIHENAPEFECGTENDEENPVICRFRDPVSCSTKGKIRVSFYDSYDKDNQNIVDTKTLELSIAIPDPDTTMETEFDDDGAVENFKLTCTHEKSCDSYDMVFYAGNQELIETKHCTTTYTNGMGHKNICQATISSDVMYEYGNDSRIYCQLNHGNRQEYREEFAFQMCSDFNSVSAECRNGSKLFKCDDTDDIVDCDACELLERCFDSRVERLEYKEGDCEDRCVLNWCRNETTEAIDKSGKIPFTELLCNG